MEKLSGLTSLDLGDNQISDLRGLEKLSGLTSLNLGDNQISDLRGLEKLTGLTSLNLGEQSNQRPPRFGKAHRADFARPRFQSNQRPPRFGKAQRADFALPQWQSNQRPPRFGKAHRADFAQPRGNQISDLRGLEKLTGLTSLAPRSGNQISDLRGLEKLTGLTSLHLGFNQISDLRGLEKLTGLTSLHLSFNQISDLRGLEKLTGLTSLHLVQSNQRPPPTQTHHSSTRTPRPKGQPHPIPPQRNLRTTQLRHRPPRLLAVPRRRPNRPQPTTQNHVPRQRLCGQDYPAALVFGWGIPRHIAGRGAHPRHHHTASCFPGQRGDGALLGLWRAGGLSRHAPAVLGAAHPVPAAVGQRDPRKRRGAAPPAAVLAGYDRRCGGQKRAQQRAGHPKPIRGAARAQPLRRRAARHLRGAGAGYTYLQRGRQGRQGRKTPTIHHTRGRRGAGGDLPRATAPKLGGRPLRRGRAQRGGREDPADGGFPRNMPKSRRGLRSLNPTGLPTPGG